MLFFKFSNCRWKNEGTRRSSLVAAVAALKEWRGALPGVFGSWACFCGLLSLLSCPVSMCRGMVELAAWPSLAQLPFKVLSTRCTWHIRSEKSQDVHKKISMGSRAGSRSYFDTHDTPLCKKCTSCSSFPGGGKQLKNSLTRLASRQQTHVPSCSHLAKLLPRGFWHDGAVLPDVPNFVATSFSGACGLTVPA